MPGRHGPPCGASWVCRADRTRCRVLHMGTSTRCMPWGTHTRRTWVRVATSLGFAVPVPGLPGASAHTGQDDSIELRTVVGCVARDADSWILERGHRGRADRTRVHQPGRDRRVTPAGARLADLPAARRRRARCRWTRRSQGPGQGTAAAQGRRVPGRPSGSDPDPHSPGSLICQL